MKIIITETQLESLITEQNLFKRLGNRIFGKKQLKPQLTSQLPTQPIAAPATNTPAAQTTPSSPSPAQPTTTPSSTAPQTAQTGVKPTIDSVKKAIENKRRVWIYYKGDGSEDGFQIKDGYRLIEPYVLGKGLIPKPRKYMPKDDNRYYLRCFVLKGEPGFFKNVDSTTLTDDKPMWRMIRLDKITSWREIPSIIAKPREGYNPNDKDLREILIAF